MNTAQQPTPSPHAPSNKELILLLSLAHRALQEPCIFDEMVQTFPITEDEPFDIY